MDEVRKQRVSAVLFGNHKNTLLWDVASMTELDSAQGLIFKILQESDSDVAARATKALLIAFPEKTIRACIQKFSLRQESFGGPSFDPAGVVGLLCGIFEGSVYALGDKDDGKEQRLLEGELLQLVAHIITCRNYAVIACGSIKPTDNDRLSKAVKDWTIGDSDRVGLVAKLVGQPTFTLSHLGHFVAEAMVYGWVKRTPILQILQKLA